MSNRRILIALAHPDDESFGLGGLIGKYVAEGVDVYLICTTNGDAGTIDPEYLQGFDSKAALRLAELDCAAQVLGFKEVFTFGYKDSGMMGAAENDDPESSWYVWNNRPEELTDRVIRVMREVKPQVVITFNKYGGYGHPDHIAIQRAATEAFNKAGDPAYAIDGLPPYQPQKLYYISIPRLMVQIGILRARLKGENPEKMGRNHDIDMIAIARHAEPSHVKVDIKDYLETWQLASACHASQGGGMGSTIPRWLQNLISSKQGLTRVYPPPSADKLDEEDLFSHVQTEEAAEPTVL